MDDAFDRFFWGMWVLLLVITIVAFATAGAAGVGPLSGLAVWSVGLWATGPLRKGD